MSARTQTASTRTVGDAVTSTSTTLDRGVRAQFEPRLGHDLSGVRVHTDATAADAARSLGARAFTHGQEVVFGSGDGEAGTRVVLPSVGGENATATAMLRAKPAGTA